MINRTVECVDYTVQVNLMEFYFRNSIVRRIYYYSEVDSTQSIAVSLAKRKSRDTHGTLIIAELQKNGHGRGDRQWISPSGGIWLSLILKPRMLVEQSTLLPLATAVAVAETINTKTKLNSKLKWPNDVLIDGKKVSGILLDIDTEGEKVDYVVVGIGINVNVDSSKITSKIVNPDELAITSLKEELSGSTICRTEFIQLLLEKLNYYFIHLEDKGSEGRKTILSKYKDLSDTIGKKVTVKEQHEAIEGTAVDIDHDGSLVVRKSNNELYRVVSADLFVRRIKINQKM